MFSRRHPLLFFLLVFSAIGAATFLGITALTVVGLRGMHLGGRMMAEADSVGVIEINGVIAESRETLENLKLFREDGAIKAIVVRVDSPGGGIGPSQEIFEEIRKTTQTKKVVVSMGGVAASGGYYIAAAADGIMANPGTITGSIGVIMGYTNMQRLLEKIGLSPVVIKSGAYKDMGSPVREMTAGERRLLSDLAAELHQQFIDDVAESRQMDVKKVTQFADGRIFSGQSAQTHGFVDRLGNLQDALEWAGRMGGIEGEIEIVYAREKKFTWIEYFTEASLKTIINRITGPSFGAGYLYRPDRNSAP